MRKLLLSLALAFAPTYPSASTPSVANFGCVTPSIYRSALPSGGDLLSLRAYGISSILDLNTGDRSAEKANAELLGLHYYNLPLSGYPLLGTGHPAPTQVRQALAILSTCPKPVLIHCLHGQDRTGVVVAAYRMSVQHWPSALAYAEARMYGISFWQFGMRYYIRSGKVGREYNH